MITSFNVTQPRVFASIKGLFSNIVWNLGALFRRAYFAQIVHVYVDKCNAPNIARTQECVFKVKSLVTVFGDIY